MNKIELSSTMYNFDKLIDRQGTQAVKWEACHEVFGTNQLFPLWVADMDFETPSFIRQALQQRLEHPIYGYSQPPQSYWQSIIDWQQRRHGWQIERQWITYIPGVVKGVAMALQTFTAPGQKVIIQPPVYHPFRIVAQKNGRQVVENPLIWDGAQLQMDFDHLESVLKPGDCKVLILCNPHNPGGRVWEAETLRTLARLCHRYGTRVISDEIHADMALFGHVHVPFATCCPEAEEIAITFAAPSKLFNIAGIVSSYTIVPNPSLRQQFFSYLDANEFDFTTFMAVIATQAAYTQGDAWREALLRYLEDNVTYVKDTLPKVLPGITVCVPQASFLVWIDCRALTQYGIKDIPQFFINAKLGLSDGAIFGEQGKGFMRLNIGCPRLRLDWTGFPPLE